MAPVQQTLHRLALKQLQSIFLNDQCVEWRCENIAKGVAFNDEPTENDHNYIITNTSPQLYREFQLIVEIQLYCFAHSHSVAFSAAACSCFQQKRS